MGRIIAALVLAIGVTACSAGWSPEPTQQLANPAAVFCEQQGGTVEVRSDDAGNQVGVCTFADGTEVDEWAFYRGEAQPQLP